ncbi:hypothetical protein CLOM_g24600 [Closterium sp. NIES-68]|nr:hypothetical protein CLOM_g24600 [Closterium sp. NIES-68]GJP74407.1 hypothetical protein CLOP_g4992 [Closterium sp. NIES-67]
MAPSRFLDWPPQPFLPSCIWCCCDCHWRSVGLDAAAVTARLPDCQCQRFPLENLGRPAGGGCCCWWRWEVLLVVVVAVVMRVGL